MKQIDLERHHHSTYIEVVKTPKRLFFVILAMWIVLVLGFAFLLGYGWMAVALAVFSAMVGGAWVSTYPEYHMRRLKD